MQCGRCSIQLLQRLFGNHLLLCTGSDSDAAHVQLHVTQGIRCSHGKHLVPVTSMMEGCSRCSSCHNVCIRPEDSAGQQPAKRSKHITNGSATDPLPGGSAAAIATPIVTVPASAYPCQKQQHQQQQRCAATLLTLTPHPDPPCPKLPAVRP